MVAVFVFVDRLDVCFSSRRVSSQQLKTLRLLSASEVKSAIRIGFFFIIIID
jgi:hypothetical protein